MGYFGVSAPKSHLLQARRGEQRFWRPRLRRRHIGGPVPRAVHCPASLEGWVQGRAGCVEPTQGALSEEIQSRSRGIPRDPDWNSLVLSQEKSGASVAPRGMREWGKERQLSPLRTVQRTEPPRECHSLLAGGFEGHPLEIRLSSAASGHSTSPPKALPGLTVHPVFGSPNLLSHVCSLLANCKAPARTVDYYPVAPQAELQVTMLFLSLSPV